MFIVPVWFIIAARLPARGRHLLETPNAASPVTLTLNPNQSPVALLIEPHGVLAEALCQDLFGQGARLVAVGGNPRTGPAFTQRLAAEGIPVAWRLLDTDLSNCVTGLRTDLAKIYGRVNSIVSFFRTVPSAADQGYLTTPPATIVKLIEKRLRARLGLLQELSGLLAHRRAVLLNLYIGLREQPDCSKGLNGHVTGLLDNMLAHVWQERGVTVTQQLTHCDNGFGLASVEHLMADLQQALTTLAPGFE